MEHSLLNPIKSKEEMITAFTGYDHRITATEGSYYDMKNMTSDYYPAMSPRKRRGICHTFTRFQGMINSDNGLLYVDNGKLYQNDQEVDGISLTTDGMKNLVKIGSNIVIFPDKKWYNTAEYTTGNLEAYLNLARELEWSYARDDGTIITGVDLISPTPQDGDYKKELINGKPAIYQYSALTQTWNPVTPIYTAISSDTNGLFDDFKEGDGVKITLNSTYLTEYEKNNIYVNKENYGDQSVIVTIAKKPDSKTIVLPFDSGYSGTRVIFGSSLHDNSIRRIVPQMYDDSIFECQNRLWGGSIDGHEIYCSKLGDPTNWNVFQGISTDSWVATIGSVGTFTGGVNYQGYPIFFKEDSMIKISLSSVGGHSLVETKCRGVSKHSSKSLAIVDNILYYKSKDAVCAFDGSYPIVISDSLGNVAREDFDESSYSYVVGGSNEDKYYINIDGTLYVYDTKYGIWSKEDQTGNLQFCNRNGDLFFASIYTLYSVNGSNYKSGDCTQENAIDWEVVSNDIGYLYTGRSHSSRINAKKYIQKMIMQVSLTIGSHLSVYINYDSSDQWEFLYNFSGTTTSLCKLPIRPHRCNHFRYKIVGHGDAKIYSITKYYVEGSDV